MQNTGVRNEKNKTSKYKGVQKLHGCSKNAKPWRAIATLDGKPKHLGVFYSEIEAALAYDTWTADKYGEFASLNFNS